VNLFAATEHLCATASPQSVDDQSERTRDRCTRRQVRVFVAPQEAPFSTWPALARIIEVERTGTRGTKAYAERMFYVSSHTGDAADFARIIRGHWQIENALHWVKDVILDEDDCATRGGHALYNGALLRSLAITLFRLHGYRSIKNALRSFAHDVPALVRLLQ
jgi:predicted transposase YbfD/YdcC